MIRTLLIAAIISAAPVAAIAQPVRSASANEPAALAQLEQSLVGVIARCEPSVVAISRVPQPNAEAQRLGDVFREFRENANVPSSAATVGAGVIIDPTGLVLTHYLAVKQGELHAVTTTDRTTYRAEIRAADPRSGLAVLAIDTKSPPLQHAGTSAKNGVAASFPALRFGDAATLRKGQFVIAIGNPYAIQTDGQPTASWGTVTNLARKAPAGANFNDAPGPGGDYRTTIHHLGTLIQTDAKLGFSAAGGALLNLRGELIGLTTTTATIAGHEQPAGYAIPINATTRRIIDTLKEGREVEYGMLGVGFAPSNLQLVRPNATPLTIVSVLPGSPGAKAGLRPNDIVTHVAGQPVRDVDSVQLAISTLPPSTVAKIGFIRDGHAETADLTLTKLPLSGTKIVTRRLPAWNGLRVDYASAVAGSDGLQGVGNMGFDPAGCVFITDVERGSVAWKAGARKGMFISHVGEKRVTTPAEFEAAARELGDRYDVRLTQPAVSEPEKRPRQPPSKP